MISVNRLFFLAVLFFSGTLFAAPLTPQSVKLQIQNRFISKILRDTPYLTTSDIKIMFKNPEVFAPPVGAVSFQFEFAEPSHVLGKTVIPLNYLDASGNICLKTRVATEALAYSLYVVVKQVVPPDTVITSEDVYLFRALVDTSNFQAYRKVSDVVGKMSRGTLGLGTILSPRMIKTIPVVFKDTMVLIVMPEAGFSLEVKGRALEDGGIGDMIRVQSTMDNRKIFRGKVQDEKTVILHAL